MNQKHPFFQAEKTFSFDQGVLNWVEIGQGEPLVLLHGWSMSHLVFTEMAEALAQDFRLLIPDLPGHGKSSALCPLNLDALVRSLYSWLDSLSLAPVHLLGWSLGGQIALALAESCSSLIKRMVLISSTPRFCASDDWDAGFPEQNLLALRRGLRRDFQSTLRKFFDLQFETENISAERLGVILKFAVSPASLPVAHNAIAALDLLATQDLRASLAVISQPALVIHGTEDKIIPWAAGQFLSRHLQQARLVTMPGIGHAPFLSRPQDVVDQIRKFCR